MGKRTILGSLFVAIFLAAAVFFVLFFFVPTISQTFFNVSYQSLRDSDQLKSILEDTLKNARVPEIAVDEYIDRLEDKDFYRTVQEKSKEGEDALLGYLAEAGEGIDFGDLEVDRLKTTLKEGLSQTQQFTSSQLSALSRLFSETIGNL
ncbi:MAG: hypothetical protein PQJ47_02115 [Sphaerochaetaceae bacterium]|nr:hypothetical protein [Sphaerochaetaceae bacterium]MDC7247120.1 hypothetical protein [Sphaerochaetaceae bacterium]